MEDSQKQLEALQDIRQMMKQSSRFLSLSGLSGILAGFYALGGAYFGEKIVSEYMQNPSKESGDVYFEAISKCFIVCALVLIASLVTAFLMSSRKARRNGETMFDHTAIRLLINMMIPLGAGGIFCIALLVNGFSTLEFVCPSMLIFYGLALVNGSKYTIHDIRYLGCLEILLGLLSSFWISHGILFWALGFGVLHIVYGAIMWYKYDRNS